MKKKIKNIFLDILYPRHCPVCHDIAVPRGQKICTSCRGKLKPITGPRCFRCSKPLGNSEQEYCRDCERVRYFDQGMGIFPYSSVLQASLYWLKYGKRQEYGVFYGQVAAAYTNERIKEWGVEVIIPIPLHRKRMEKRGYNQAEIIAQAAGKRLGVPMDTRILKRAVNTKPQKELDAKQRKENLKNAFQVKKKFCEQRILLVDDIYTTGATIDAAAKVLKRAGAQKVYFLTIAIGTDA